MAKILQKRPTISPNQLKILSTSKKEIDYLCEKFDIKDSRDLFSWGIKMLYDLSKLDENGWRLTLNKCEINEETKQVTTNQDYKNVYFLMKWLKPQLESFARLPLPETLEKIMKIEK